MLQRHVLDAATNRLSFDDLTKELPLKVSKDRIVCSVIRQVILPWLDNAVNNARGVFRLLAMYGVRLVKRELEKYVAEKCGGVPVEVEYDQGF